MIDEEWDYSFKGESIGSSHSKEDVLKRVVNKMIGRINNPLKVVLANYENEQKVIEDLQRLHADYICYPKRNKIV